MLTVIRNDEGQLEAACEWWTVNEKGQWFGGGKYIYVSHLEISKGVDSKILLEDLFAIMAWEEPQAISAYWIRRSKTGEKPREYSRERLFKRFSREVVVR